MVRSSLADGVGFCSLRWQPMVDSPIADLLLVHVAEHAVVVGVGMGDLGDLETGEILLVDVPLEAFRRRPGLVLGDVVDLPGRAGLVVGRRDVPPGPVARAAVAGVRGHGRSVGRGVPPDEDGRAGIAGDDVGGGLQGLARGGGAVAGQDEGQDDRAERRRCNRIAFFMDSSLFSGLVQDVEGPNGLVPPVRDWPWECGRSGAWRCRRGRGGCI